MSLDTNSFDRLSGDMTDAQAEAARQIEICNACRYCEGFCSAFPAMFRDRVFDAGTVTQLANLCHNCRGCYYACQYTEPHEFALNLPAALAEVRTESWETYAWPGPFARLFQRHGLALAAALVVGISALFWALSALGGSGDGFYAHLSHGAMVAIFVPAFLLPLAAMAVALRGYWRGVGGTGLVLGDWAEAGRMIAEMRNLGGGQGQGCNFENTDRFSNARRHAHQAVLWGFVLCFASTGSGTVLHYLFGLEAPYSFFSLPKLLGVPGGLLLVIGTVGMAVLKTKADRTLGDASVWGGEMGFILLLGLTGLTGLMLYAATGTGLVPGLLALHLGTVLTFFLTLPYSKMAHGFFRTAALLRDAQIKRERAG